MIGEYKHTLDPKKRLSLPSKWRKELGKKLVVTRGFDNCLFVYPLKEWRKAVNGMSHSPLGPAGTRDIQRFLLSGAVEVEVDSVGRILVPDFLKDFAALESKAVFAGVHDRVEIWAENRWEDYKKRIEAEANQLAERLGGLKIL